MGDYERHAEVRRRPHLDGEVVDSRKGSGAGERHRGLRLDDEADGEGVSL